MQDIHPIKARPGEDLESRVHYLEIALARLWDFVWWHQLPFYRRWFYLARGFRSPIRNFYKRLD